MPEDISEVIDASTNTVRDLGLQPYFTTSTWKASGFAGSVALRVKNVGAKRYWGEFPAVTFRVEVATFAGPEGVDRLITTTNYNGSHVRDLGYDFDRGVRTFEVTLSNPVAAGDEMLRSARSTRPSPTSASRSAAPSRAALLRFCTSNFPRRLHSRAAGAVLRPRSIHTCG